MTDPNLQDRVADLEKKVRTLEAHNRELEAQVAELRTTLARDASRTATRWPQDAGIETRKGD